MKGDGMNATKSPQGKGQGSPIIAQWGLPICRCGK